MLHTVFSRLFRLSYQHPGRAIYALPLAIIAIFALLTGVMLFSRTDKVVDTHGEIMPQMIYTMTMPGRGFIVENHIARGRRVRAGEPLLVARMETGALATFNASHSGVIVDSDLRDMIDGPVPESALIAAVVDPDELGIRVTLDAKHRGTVRTGATARYKLEMLTPSVRSRVFRQELRLLKGQDVDYYVFAELRPEHKRIEYLGRRTPIKILIREVSILEYLFTN